VEILAQSSADFALHNFQGTHILGASRGHLSDSVGSCFGLLHTFSRTLAAVQNADALAHAVFDGSIDQPESLYH